MLRSNDSRPQNNSQAKFLRELQTDSKKGKVRLAFSIDVGSGTLVIAICEDGVVTIVESPMDGTLIPTAVFEDPKTKQRYFGSEALQRAFDAPEQLAMHTKKSLSQAIRAKLFCDGKYNAIEMTTALLDHAFELLVSFRPDLKDDYPMFGGTTYSADELVFTLTIPSLWGVEETAAFEESVKASKFGYCDGFMKEPTAAARYLAHVPRVKLGGHNKIAVIDLGAGTSDFQILEYTRGTFDVISAAIGDGNLGGHDFTNALAVQCAREMQVPWKGIYDKTGFHLGNAKPEDREAVIEIWQKMEKEVKPRLAMMDSVEVVLSLPGGRKKFNTTRAKAAKLWRPPFTALRKCITDGLAESGLKTKDLDHVLVVGGTASVYGLPAEIAKALGCKESDLIVCKDSAHVIAAGAAEHGFHQEEFSQSIPGGLGLRMLQQGELETHLNACLIKPGQIVTSDGFYGEWSGYCIVKGTADARLRIETFAVKTGVRVEMTEGQHTLLEDSEVIYFEPIDVLIEHWPAGEHEVDLGITADVNGNLALLIRPKDLPDDIEVLAVRLNLAKGSGKELLQVKGQAALDAVILLDGSGSMKGAKVAAVIEGALGFVEDMIKDGSSVGIIVFPSGQEVAKCVVPLTKNKRKLQAAIKGLQAAGGTATDAALRLAIASLERSQNAVGVLYTDGHPRNREEAFKASNEFKENSFLICVPIGEDVNRPDLRKMASDGGFVDGVVNAEDIPSSFKEVHARIRYSKDNPKNGEKKASSPKEKSQEPKPPEPKDKQESATEPDAESWDDVEGVDEEAA